LKPFTRFPCIYHKFLKYFTHCSAVYLFCIFHFFFCSFSLKVYANGSQPGSWTDCLLYFEGRGSTGGCQKAMNGTYKELLVSSFGCQENTVPAAASAVAGGPRGTAPTKVSQNYAIYAIYVARQQRFLAGTRTHRVNQKTHLAPVASLCCLLPAACCMLLPSLLCCCLPHFWQHKFANHVRDLSCNAVLLLLLSCVCGFLFVCW